MRTARVAGLAAGVQLLVVAPLVLAAPSEAGPRRLLVAPTAAGPWGDRLEEPLFADVGELVPGDRVTETFWVRNGSAQTALASAALSDPDPANDLERGLRFSARLGGVRADPGRPVAAADEGPVACTTSAAVPTIPAGGVRSMTVTLRYADRGPGAAQAARPDLVLTLSEQAPVDAAQVCGVEATAAPPAVSCAGSRGAVAVVVARSGCGDEDGPGAVALPDTGAGRDAARSLGLGLGCLAAGAALLQVQRRRERAARQRPVMSRNVSG